MKMKLADSMVGNGMGDDIAGDGKGGHSIRPLQEVTIVDDHIHTYTSH